MCSDTTFLTFQGDIYVGNSGFTNNISSVRPSSEADANADISGGNLLARLTHTLSATDELKMQIYYDRTVRDMEILAEIRDTFDFEFQHCFQVGVGQQVTWGGGYRITYDHPHQNEVIVFNPESRTDNLFSAFIQDRISLWQDQLVLTLGSKFEYNDYSGFEIQPSARLRWTISPGHTLWAAVSRAVRTPARADHDLQMTMSSFSTGPTMNYVTIYGNDHFDSEELVAYEVGYRLHQADAFSLDMTAFYNVYNELRATVMAAPDPPFSAYPPPDERVLPINIINQDHQDTYGVEISSNLELSDWWRLSCTYSWFHSCHFSDDKPGSICDNESSPAHQFSCRSFINLPGNLEFDSALFYVDDLFVEGTTIPDYTRIDLRLGWQPWENLEFSLKLENLLDNRHPEFASSNGIVAAQVPRSFYGKISWQF